MNERVLNAALIDKYYYENGVLPPIRTLVKMGGNIKYINCFYKNYRAFLREIGYSDDIAISGVKLKKYRLIDATRNRLVMVGTLKEIRDNFFPDKKQSYIRRCIYKHTLINCQYRIEKKENENGKNRTND